MHADPVTRCPHCQAVYRVTLAQLAQAQGWLRCAQCRAPFDGTGLQVKVEAIIAELYPITYKAWAEVSSKVN